MNRLSFFSVFFIFFIFPIFASAGLVDYYNFDDVTANRNATVWASQSSHKINCTEPTSYPSCVRQLVGAAGSGYASIVNSSTYTNGNYLYLSATNGEPVGGYKAASVRLTLDNLTTLTNMTIEYDFKYSERIAGATFTGTQSYNTFGGLRFTNFNYGAGTYTEAPVVGGEVYYPVEEVFNNLKARYKTTGYFEEWNSTCYMTPYDWHKITIQYYMNSTFYVERRIMYIDGVLCDSYPMNIQLSPTNKNLLSLITFEAQATYYTGYDNIALYDQIKEPSVITSNLDNTLLDCPYSRCIFYDDYDYVDDYNLTSSNYYGGTEAGVVRDFKLYVDSTISSNQIKHNFKSHNYHTVKSYKLFNFNETTTPSSLTLEGLPVIYGLRTMCLNENSGTTYPIEQTVVYFIRDDSSSNENMTRVIVLDGYDNSYLYEKLIDNTDDFYIYTEYIEQEQRIYYKFFTNSFSDDFNIDLNDAVYADYLNNCRNVYSFEVNRLDVDNPVNIDFVGLDEVIYYGYIDDDTTEDFEYVYGEEVSVNDSIITGDMSEYIHNTATTLGFKTENSRFLFWIIVVGLLVIGLWQMPIGDTAKIYGGATTFFIMMTFGFYIKMIPLSVFIVFILLSASALALAFYSIFGNTSGE